MEVKQKLIPFPFWRTVSFGNYMRINKRLPLLKRKKKQMGVEILSFIYLLKKNKFLSDQRFVIIFVCPISLFIRLQSLLHCLLMQRLSLSF